MNLSGGKQIYVKPQIKVYQPCQIATVHGKGSWKSSRSMFRNLALQYIKSMLYSQAVPHPALKFQEFIPLAPYTTFQIGGPARFFCEAKSEPEIEEAVSFAQGAKPAALCAGWGKQSAGKRRGI